MKFFNLILILSTLLFISCELEEEEEKKDSVTSCEAKETIKIDLGFTDIGNNFTSYGILANSVVTESSCENLSSGDVSSDTLQSIIRSNSILSLTDSEGTQNDFGINGVTLTYPDFSLEVENCKVYLKGSGLLNLSENQIIINLTSGYEGSGCLRDLAFRPSFF
jgi:hypothetical protein